MMAKKNKTKTIKRSAADRAILSLGYSILALFTIAIVIPLAYVQIPAKRCTHSEINSAAIPM